jgi:hypothetical protein
MFRHVSSILALTLTLGGPALANPSDVSHVHLRGHVLTPSAVKGGSMAGIAGTQVSVRILSHQQCLLDRRIGDVFIDAVLEGQRSMQSTTSGADGSWEIVLNFPRAWTGLNSFGVQTPEWLECVNFVNNLSARDVEVSGSKAGYTFHRP